VVYLEVFDLYLEFSVPWVRSRCSTPKLNFGVLVQNLGVLHPLGT